MLFEKLCGDGSTISYYQLSVKNLAIVAVFGVPGLFDLGFCCWHYGPTW